MEYNDVVNKMKERYFHIHPLIFHRSVERARNVSELFDILDAFIDKYPLIWDTEVRNWVQVQDAALRGTGVN